MPTRPGDLSPEMEASQPEYEDLHPPCRRPSSILCEKNYFVVAAAASRDTETIKAYLLAYA
jgi:hypothetical protein